MDEELKKAKRKSKREITQKAALAIEAVALVQIKEMAASIKDYTLTSMAKVDAEVEAYKKSRMAKIDEEVKTRVLEISKQILGDTIDLKTHEELVIKALENAKRSGVLSTN
ncbi:MAG: hypothetical protein AAB656_04535 [Patescibacteria group bacterium]